MSFFVVPVEPVIDSVGYRISKRLADIFISLAALLILFPVTAVVAALIWIEDRGPILFVKPRVGRFGAPIRFYKFRSMTVDAERMHEGLLSQSDSVGLAFKMKNDPRVTRVGKFIRRYSIDELPQLISVLLGDMSIVGPRPLAMGEGYKCGETNMARYLVKPGLVCLREVKGRSHLSFEEWMRLDLEYIQNRNLLLDLKIFLALFPAVLAAKGAY
ncbi:MAG TPA: sugar transferase [Fimbriimonas sp.]|nr:sugar transferase [Fimbriimonas sp.]